MQLQLLHVLFLLSRAFTSHLWLATEQHHRQLSQAAAGHAPVWSIGRH